MMCCVWGPCPLEFWNECVVIFDVIIVGGKNRGGGGEGGGVSVVGLVVNTHTYKTFTRSFTNTHWERAALLLPVVAKLDGGAVEDAAEGDRLNFPVSHGVAEQADARVHGLLGVEAGRTEVTCSHSANLVGMEVDHLRMRKRREWQ